MRKNDGKKVWLSPCVTYQKVFPQHGIMYVIECITNTLTQALDLWKKSFRALFETIPEYILLGFTKMASYIFPLIILFFLLFGVSSIIKVEGKYRDNKEDFVFFIQTR